MTEWFLEIWLTRNKIPSFPKIPSLWDVILDAEDGKTTIFRNVESYSTDDTTSYPKSINTDFFCSVAKKKNYCAQPCADLTNVGFKNDGCIESGRYIVMSAYQSIDYPTHLPAIPLPENIALAFNITLINLQPSFCVCQFFLNFLLDYLNETPRYTLLYLYKVCPESNATDSRKFV